MPHVPLAIQVTLVMLVLCAAVFDLRFRRIPNWLNAAGALAGLVLNTAAGGWQGLKMAALGLVVAFAVNVLFYAVHALGAGDVKLFMAIGALAGTANWLQIFIFTGLAGGVLAVILIVVKGRVRKTLWNVGFLLSEIAHFRAPYMRREELDVKSEKAMRLPRAISIAVGTLAFEVLLYLAG